MPLIFITSGSAWQVPNDCFVIDWVDCIGAGGGAVNSVGSRGGRGGAWSRSINLGADAGIVPGALIDIVVNPGVAVGKGSDTCFNATSLSQAALLGPTKACAAEGGGGGVVGSNASGGLAANGTGVQKYSGGSAGSIQRSGGGGAAGPNGNGGNSGGSIGSAGGSGDAGYGGGSGAAGAEYDASHGSGGGGQGGRGAGGLFGGGAGGGAGTQPSGGSLIALSYTPGKGAPPLVFNMPMLGM